MLRITAIIIDDEQGKEGVNISVTCLRCGRAPDRRASAPGRLAGCLLTWPHGPLAAA